VPREWTSGIYEVALILYIVGFLVAGRFVNRFGAKRLLVLSASLAALFVMVFLFMPNLWIALSLDMSHVWFAAIASVSFKALILDQVPKSRGTIMSLDQVFQNIGNVIAPALGGALLVLTGGVYGAIGLGLGTMTIAGTVILFFFAKDPNRP
jgi:MFS family permease